jgi:hypothetical protein
MTVNWLLSRPGGHEAAHCPPAAAEIGFRFKIRKRLDLSIKEHPRVGAEMSVSRRSTLKASATASGALLPVAMIL